MMDRYTKVVLTVIAVALVWLCIWGRGTNWGTPAMAEGIMPANEPSLMEKMATMATIAAAQRAGSDVVIQEGAGRFRIEQLEGFASGFGSSAPTTNDHVLLDTETGRTWVWLERSGDKKGEKEWQWHLLRADGVKDAASAALILLR